MCVSQRWIINKYDGSKHFVKCGQCEACKQEKALDRTNRVKSEFNSSGRICVFVTLSYADQYVPYIYKEDLYNFVDSIEIKSNIKITNQTLPVYRRFHRQNSNHGTYLVKMLKDPIIEYSLQDMYRYGKDIDIPISGVAEFKNLHRVRNGIDLFDYDKIGVLHYEDVRNFLKRLKVYLQRRGYEERYESFYVGEYGGDYSRPHFHVLFSIPQGDYELFKTAILACWSFSDHSRLEREVELARDPASYLASYVNCDEDIPALLQVAAPFRPLHKYSHGFGMSLGEFSYEAVKEAYYRRDLKYDVWTTQNGTPSWTSVPIPKYVINRYFPKFKGFGRLATHEVYDVLQRPYLIYRFKEKCKLNDEDCEKVVRQIRNTLHRKNFWTDNLDEYFQIYSHIHNVDYMTKLKWSLQNVKSYQDWLQYYYNIGEFVDQDSIRLYRVAPTLGRLHGLFDTDTDYNPNVWKDNLRVHNRLIQAWHMYKKNRQINNELTKLKYSYG